MLKNTLKRSLSLVLVFMMLVSFIPNVAWAADLTGLTVNGLSASYENGTWSTPAGNSIKGNVKTSKGSCNNTTVTGTLTLTNNLSATANLSFNWSANPNYGTLKIGGSTVSGTSGTKTIELAAGASTTVVITSADSDNGISSGITVTLSNIQLQLKAVNATVTFIPGEHGSYTLDGAPVTASVTRTQSSTVPFQLSAAPDEGYEFSGWFNVTGNSFLSYDNPVALNVGQNITIQPKFVPAGSALFLVGTTYYLDLNEANTAAQSANPKTIILARSGSLFEGNYTISSGVTLLIPYNSANTVVKSIKTSTNRTYVKPVEYSRLTLAPGANITVNGSISVAAPSYSMSGGGTTVSGGPTEAYGRIDLTAGSSITLNSGAYLYAYGYVTGDGQITAKSGSVVKELFQLTEFRGGTALSNMNNNSQKVFPMSQYFVQNIEAPITFQYGAKEQLDMTVYAGGSPSDVTNIPFIGSSDGLFRAGSECSVTKRYDPKEDRLSVDIYGDASLQSITISLGVSVSSSKYVLPISNNIDINIHSGTTTIPNSTEILPGARVRVDEGAAVTLSSGVNLFVYDSTEWNKATNGYNVFFGYQKDTMPLPFTPTSVYTRSSADCVDVLVDVNGTVNVSGNLMTTASGANITSSLGTGKIVMNKVGSATLYQCSQSGSDVSYHQISVTSAQLKNGDDYAGTEEAYVKTATTGTGTYFYNLEVQKWYKYKVDYVFNGQVVYTDYTATNTSTYDASGLTLNSVSATNGTAANNNGTVNVTGLTGNSTVTLSGTPKQFLPTFVLSEKDAGLYQSYTGNTLTETAVIDGETYYVVSQGAAANFGSAVAAPSDADMGVNAENHNAIVWKLGKGLASLDFEGTVPAGETAGGPAYIFGIYSGVVASLATGGVTSYYTTLKAAFLAAPNTGASVIELLADCGTFEPENPDTAYAILSGANVTFNLNGHKAVGAISNSGTLTMDLMGGELEYRTGATAASSAYRASAALTNKGSLVVLDSVGGGKISTDAISDNGVPNHATVILNKQNATLSVSGVTLENVQDVNGYTSVVMNDRGTITALQNVTMRSPRGYAVFNYGGQIALIDSCDIDVAYGIYNRNIRGTTYTSAAGCTITNYGVIDMIKDSTVTAGQYAISNNAVIHELNNCTFTAHPDSAQVNTYGTTAANVQGNVQCYTVFNSNAWWYDTSLWKRTDVMSGGYSRTDEYKEGLEYRPTIGSIVNCNIYAENTSTSAEHGCALYNNGGYIGSISDGEIRTYKHQNNSKISTSNYALRNTAGGVIDSISGVTIYATGNSAVYNDGQFTAQAFNAYSDKIGGIQLHNLTTYGDASSIGSMSGNALSAGGVYAIYTNGYIGSISGGSLSANYNALLNSGSGALSSYEFVRTYTSNTDASTETRREETYVRNMERGGVIGSISGVQFVGTGTNSYYLLQNQGYIGSLSNSGFSAASPRAGESYAMVMNGDSRQTGYTLTREPYAYESLYITPYEYHYDYTAPVIGTIDNVTITKNATYAFRNLGVIETLSNSTITGTQYVLVNAASGPYVERDSVRYYSGATKFATTKNNGSEITYFYNRDPAEIGTLENNVITGTSTYTLYNGGHLGTLTGNDISASNTTVLYNGGTTVRSWNYNLKDIITVTATDSACKVAYGVNDETKIVVTDYDAPVIGLIGAGNHISGTYQTLVNLGEITAIDGGEDPVTITATTQKQIGLYNYAGTLDARTATTPYTAGTEGTAVNTDTYLNAHIGLIRNAIITSNGVGIQNGSASATYLPVIDELGEGLEVNANSTTAGYHAVYNTTYAKIAAITGGVYTAKTATTNAYRNNNTDPEHATLISGGDFKGMADTRSNAIFEPDNTNRQTYPEGKTLSDAPENVTLHDGSTGTGYYFIGTTITVTFDANGGTGTMDAQTAGAGREFTLNANTFTREGFTFNGWNTASDGSGTAYEDGASLTLDADVTLYAQWQAHVHTWGEPSYEWSADNGSCTATVICQTCDHTETETVNTTSEITKAATCEEMGETTYTATFTNSAFETQTKTETDVPALGHDWNEPTYTWSADNSQVTATRSCKRVSSHAETETVNTTSTVTKPASCEEMGETTYTASFANAAFSAQTKTEADIPSLGHDWNEPTWNWTEDLSAATATFVCKRDASHTHAVSGNAMTEQGTGEFQGKTIYTVSVTGPDGAVYTAKNYKTNTYTVTWKNWNGQVLRTDENVPYGTTPVYGDAAPEREMDAQYSYSFSGWDPEPSAITGDTTYTAQYENTLRSYTVRFLDANGNEISSNTYPYGTAAEDIVVPTAPEKAADAQFTYTFSGWTPTISVVTGNADYTASYTGELRSYTVTWKNWDGQVLRTDENVPYGTTPAYGEAAPGREPDAFYSYVFAGWTPEIAVVVGDTVYTATFAQTQRTYTVTFDRNAPAGIVITGEMADLTVYSVTEIQLTKNSFMPDPQTDDCVFDCWNTKADGSGVAYTDEQAAAFQEDTTLYAQWTVKSYTITWNDWDGSELYSAEFAYGTTPAYPYEDPDRPADAQYSYSFTGWSPEITAVSGDKVYTANYSSTLRSYTVTWKDEDGTVLDVDYDVPYGTIPTYDGETPTKEGDAQYSYVFSGWSPNLSEVTGDITYTATYRQDTNTYTVTWNNYDGTELHVDYDVPYGTIPTYTGEAPEKEGTQQYSYRFVGWTPAVSAVTGDVTYTATFESIVNRYTVTFVDEDGTTLLGAAEYDYGTQPADIVKPADPEKPATPAYTYTFAGWDPAVAEVTENVVYRATYTAEKNSYTVTWLDDDGETTLATSQVEFGQIPAFPGNLPSKQDAQFSYVLAGWEYPELDENGQPVLDDQDQPVIKQVWLDDPDAALPAVERDAVYTAIYNKTLRSYEITWQMDDGALIDTTVVEYGTVPTHADAVKPATAEFTYEFTGWTPTLSAVTGEATYTAVFREIKNVYTITWKMDDGTLIGTTEVEYGTVPTHADPVKTEDAQYTYTFKCWSPEPVAVTGAAEYKAVFDKQLRTYTVRWVDEDGTVLETDEGVEYGVTPSYDGAEPTKPSDELYDYSFSGWTPTVSSVTGDATYTATYAGTLRSFTIIFNAGGGTVDPGSITIQAGVPIGELPTPVREEKWAFMGWYTTPAESYLLVTQGTRVDETATFTGDTILYARWRLRGDVDGDGKVSGADLVRLAEYIKARGVDVQVVPGSVNINGSTDNRVDGQDLIRLAEYIKARGFGVEIN